jgi:hypothetical protein
MQIMPPAYEGDPEEPKVVPRERWYAPPAEVGVGVNARVRGADRSRPNGSGRGPPVSLREQDRAWAA